MTETHCGTMTSSIDRPGAGPDLVPRRPPPERGSTGHRTRSSDCPRSRSRRRIVLPLTLLIGCSLATNSHLAAQVRSQPKPPTLTPPGDSPNNPSRPIRTARRGALDPTAYDLRFRSIDGTGNNIENPLWGAADVPLLRVSEAAYADGTNLPSGNSRPSAREISNACMAQAGDRFNPLGVTDMFWQWGQFLDHDITLTPIADPLEEFPIEVPSGDAWFDPTASGIAEIPLERSSYDVVDGVRQQVNEITAYIDASNVYGSDPERAQALRTLDGTGRLATSDGDLLPFNTGGLPNAPSTAPTFFLAGDFRANEQVGLTAMHTLFLREHNFWANRIRATNPELTGDEIYDFARMLVGAEMQAITYREFLPLLLGPAALTEYQGYRPDVDAGIANEFATAAYRVGHTMLSSEILRLEEDGSPSAAGNLSLAQAFFSPDVISEHGIDTILRGLTSKRAQSVDLEIIDDVRNLLFGPPGSGGLDLASLNIQRGREHGLADYNTVREAFGLPRVRRFRDITDPETAQQLQELYGDPDDVDLWVGGLAERPVPGGMVGPTFRAILADQFTRLRDGDRFWYRDAMPMWLVDLVERQTLDVIIRRNTGIGGFLRDDVFRLPADEPPLHQP